MYNTYLSETKIPAKLVSDIYWWFADYYLRLNSYYYIGEKNISALWGTYCIMSGQIVVSLLSPENDCANGDEADVTFVKTRKTQSLYIRDLSTQLQKYSTTQLSRICRILARSRFLVRISLKSQPGMFLIHNVYKLQSETWRFQNLELIYTWRFINTHCKLQTGTTKHNMI